MSAVGEGKGGFKLNLFGLNENFQRLTQIPGDMRARSNKHAPKASKNNSGLPAGYERCWCHGFNIGCGLIRSATTRRNHAIRERERRKGKVSVPTHYIRRQLLILRFLETQAARLVDILMELVNEDNDEDHLDAPREPQDEGVSVDDRNLEAADDQPHDATMDFQDDALDLHIDQPPSPLLEPGPSRPLELGLLHPLEPGPLCDSRARQVFEVGHDSDANGEEEEEEEHEGGDTYVWFKPDVWSEAEGENDNDNVCGAQYEDIGLTQGDVTYQLDIARELHGLGSNVLTVTEKDSIKAMALKLGNQLTRKAFQGVQKLTQGRMEIGSESVAGRILERASGLHFQVYDCCAKSCVCFTGEFESLLVCPLCNEPRYDRRQKARNRFRYIPIIPRLQAMFQNPDVIELLLYRFRCEADPNRIDDVWDGVILQGLISRNVEINGDTQEYTYRELKTDVFVALTCDGISVHKGIGARQSQTEYACFPLELIILNLPPEVRTQDRYVYSLGVVLGPHEPKHLNSFFWPFYLECTRGLQGIKTYHSLDREFFPMRFYCPFSFGDLKAMIKLKGTVSVGALKPCHQCNVAAVRDIWSTSPKSKTYYVPLTVPGAEENCLLPDILQNLCTHRQFEETYHQLDTAGSEAECKRIRRETGISNSCIFSLLPYFDMARSVPHGFMHAVYINLFRALVRLWRGEYKGLDSGTGDYVIPGALWKDIGIETRQAVKIIPAAFVRSIPNIDTDFNSYTAEDNAFWLTWLAPYLLSGRLPEPYYSHLLAFVKIVKVCTGFGMTKEELSDLSTDLAEWRLNYEDHYFQHNPKRLCVMPLAGHALDHLSDDILNAGPPPALWEFVTERSMGEVARSITSRIYPFSQLANTLIQREQLKVVRMRYPDLDQELDYSGQRRDWNEVSRAEKYFPDINDWIVLWTPHSWYKLTSTEKVAIGVYFRALLGLEASPRTIGSYVPDQVERWGKMRFKGDAECVRSRWAHEAVRETYRDASFARLELVIDEYEDDPGRPAWDKRIICYGQVQSYIYVTLPAEPRLKTTHDSTAILALVTLCKTNGMDASLVPVWYRETGLVRAFDIATIDCVVGRVKVGDRWGIIDRSFGSERAVMHGMWEPEFESEDEND